LGAFFHAVAVFFDHLRDVAWGALGLAIACHLIKLLLRSRAWQNIIRAAYPEGRLRYRTALGAYVSGVGINSIAPARGGDLVKLYLVRHRMSESSYPTLASTLVVETVFDFFVAAGVMIWALSLGVLPTHEAYSRIPTVDWKWFLRHERATAIGLAILLAVVVAGLLWIRVRAIDVWGRFKQGLAILSDRRKFVLGVIFPQALSWILRVTSLYFFLQAFHVDASIHNALLALVVDSLSTLFPATPGGAGTKQGLIVVVFRKEAISKSALLAFSVGMNIALTVVNLVCALIAIGLMARTLSFKRLRQQSRAEQEQPV
jgi:uncharacterized membrane protein YbhN (UPF0104 family)